MFRLELILKMREHRYYQNINFSQSQLEGEEALDANPTPLRGELTVVLRVNIINYLRSDFFLHSPTSFVAKVVLYFIML